MSIFEILLDMIEDYLDAEERREKLDNMPIEDDWGD